MKKSVLALILLVAFFSLASIPAQLLPTSLRLTVLNNLGNPEEGVQVRLFETQEAYDAGEPILAEGTTDKKGRLKLNDLKPQIYYVDAQKDELNNIGNGIVTDTLREGRLNKVNIIID